MKKFLFLLFALVFCCSLVIACPSNGIEIITPTNSQHTLSYLSLGKMKWSIEGEKIFYEPDLNKQIGIIIEEGKISFLSKEETKNISGLDWSDALLVELTRLNAVGAIKLTEEEIIKIAELGCCGIISKKGIDWIKANQNCTETFFVFPSKNTLFNWLGILIAIIPSLLIFFYFGFFKKKIVPAFIFGILGFLIAFFLRLPILLVIQLSFPSLSGEIWFLIVAVIASALAGFFEEGFRFLFFKKIPITCLSRKNALAFGLGWGFIEMILLYVANMIAFLFFLNYPISFFESIIGAFERNFAIIFHLGATLLVFKSIQLKNKKFLWTAILLHFVLDFFTVIINFLTKNLLFAEMFVLFNAIATLLVAMKLN